MANLTFKHIDKVYEGGVRAVCDFNLEIKDKDFVVFVGPSGCGKSTTLRMIAGLEEITAGELFIDGKIVNEIEPMNRDIAMVFQNYALYPHMTVYENMAFGLKLKKMDKKEIDRRVKEAGEILGITDLFTRKPKALSGGQRQRVALGRAIVREPKVFLLDEPLSNLDAKLRVQMRTEITKLHDKLKTTFIYVTHDQTEAMTMGNRIVVMKDGYMQQADTPVALYDSPVNVFVASFLGSPQINLINATLVEMDSEVYASFGDGSAINKIKLPDLKVKQLIDKAYIGKEVILGIRPEDIKLSDDEVENSSIKAYVDVVEVLGGENIIYTKISGKDDSFIASLSARSRIKAGANISLTVDANRVHLFDKESEIRIIGVPIKNMLPAKLTQGDNASLKILNMSVNVTEDFIGRVLPQAYNIDNLKVGIIPEKLHLFKGDDDIAINTRVDFVEESSNYLDVYSIVEGYDGYLVSRQAEDSVIKSGDEQVLFYDKNLITLYNGDTQEKLNVKHPVSYNKVKATVKVRNNKAKVAFAGISITIPNEQNLDNGEYMLSIDHNACEVNKKKCKAFPSQVVTARGLDEDVLGKTNAIYVNIGNEINYFTFIVDAQTSVYSKGKLKMYIDHNKLSFVKSY